MNNQGDQVTAGQQTRGVSESNPVAGGSPPILASELRKRAFARLDEFFAEHGMPSKADAAIKRSAEAVALADLPAFFKRAVTALAARGLFRGPIDPQALAALDEQPTQPAVALEQTPGTYDWAKPDVQASQAEVAQQLPTAPPDFAQNEGSNDPQIVGDQIDKNWHGFHSDTGSLSLPRDQVPQIAAGHRGALVSFLKARGVSAQTEEVPAETLKPTQGEFSPQKVRDAIDFDGGDRSILVSNDDYILDGTHQWLKARMHQTSVKIIRLDAPIGTLLRLAHQFPSSTSAKGSPRPTAGIAASLSKVNHEVQQVDGSQGNQENGIQGVTQNQSDGKQNGNGQNANQNDGGQSGSENSPENAVADQNQLGQDGQVNDSTGSPVDAISEAVLQSQQPDAANAYQNQEQGRLPGLKPAFDYHQHPDGTVTVIGHPAEIRAALPGIRGIVGRSGVTYGRNVASQVIKALHDLAQPPESMPEPTQVVDDTNPEVGADGAQAEAAPSQAPEDGAGNEAAVAGIPDERQPSDLQAGGLDQSKAGAPGVNQPGAIESGGASDDAPVASAPTALQTRPADQAAIIDLRKRVAMLKNIAECLAQSQSQPTLETLPLTEPEVS